MLGFGLTALGVVSVLAFLLYSASGRLIPKVRQETYDRKVTFTYQSEV